MGMLLRVAGRSTNVELHGAPGAHLQVDGGDVTTGADGGLDVAARERTVRITCAEDTRVVVSTASGHVSVVGHLAEVKVITNSGAVDIERAVDVDVRTTSGRVSVGCCVHCCRVVTTSGRVSVADGHDVGVATTSARVDVGRAARAQVSTVSGSVTVGGVPSASVQARSMSGTVTVTLPSGTAATARLRSKSGSVANEVATGEGAVLDVSTVSGAIRVDQR